MDLIEVYIWIVRKIISKIIPKFSFAKMILCSQKKKTKHIHEHTYTNRYTI